MHARGTIAVAGATGRVGHHVVDVLEEGTRRRRDLPPLGVDVVTGEGLAEALAGVETVVDAATGPSPEEGRPPSSSRRPRGICKRSASEPACSGSSWSRSSASTASPVATRPQSRPRSGRCWRARSRSGSCARHSSTSSCRSSSTGADRTASATSRRCARSWSQLAASPRRSPTSLPCPTRSRRN